MYENKNKQATLALLTACACGMAILCFLMPMVAVDFFGTWSWNGFNLIAESGDDAYPLIISLACSAIGLILALIAIKNRKVLIGNIVLSVIGMTFILILFAESDLFGEAGIGFYAFVVMHLAALIMSIVALTRPTGEIMNKVVPAKLVKECPKCEKTVGVDQIFCDGCGADLRKKPEPPKENRCKVCGKAIDNSAVFCRFCGASIKDIPPTSTTPPTFPVSPTSTVYPSNSGKTKRTAICPHCGARQSEDTTNCKYCGTLMK